MKFIEKTKEFGKKHGETIKNIVFIAATTVGVGCAYAYGVRHTHEEWSDMLNKAAFQGGVRLTHRPTGDTYKMILEKVVEEVVEG